MSIQGWQVIMWQRVGMKPKDLFRLIPRFRHLGTSLQLGEVSEGHCVGSTVWGCDYMGKQLGLTWEWIEVKPRVVALGDPMVLLSNVELMSDEEDAVEQGDRLLALHRVIYALPWQKQVVAKRWHTNTNEHLLAA